MNISPHWRSQRARVQSSQGIVKLPDIKSRWHFLKHAEGNAHHFAPNKGKEPLIKESTLVFTSVLFCMILTLHYRSYWLFFEFNNKETLMNELVNENQDLKKWTNNDKDYLTSSKLDFQIKQEMQDWGRSQRLLLQKLLQPRPIIQI